MDKTKKNKKIKEIKETKEFKDSVHGYISIPRDYCSCFIDTEIFQRLRRIEQTPKTPAVFGGRRKE
ncbi:MAG: hypothetical protein JXB88_02170 [Spirochaetales bacterium]|nr:hypothetical protein [Spirochaetales bacterium]